MTAPEFSRVIGVPIVIEGIIADSRKTSKWSRAPEFMFWSLSSRITGYSVPGFNEDRITSYNVCYTKLLRAKVIELKGATVHAPGNAISAMIESVVRDRKQVIPVATYLDGEYGHSNVTIGVPAVIGKNGVEKIVELDLNEEEKTAFDAA